MSRVFWDTNLFIYLLEPNREFSAMTKNLRIRMLTRGDQLLTSTITLGEVLVKPTQAGDVERCRKYERAISSAATLVPFDIKAAWHYASIKTSRSVQAPDAVQLACAASAGVDLFITNDDRLQNKQVPGIQFIVPLVRVPL
ncbi:MAG TPA: PIN domain-containing protein [Terriglobales bacterium]|jgi:predicted nucleic acid-binding protein|nr:PIN domain-containing protein [Terriglobales bacterium]